jgi:hypothetical protein
LTELTENGAVIGYSGCENLAQDARSIHPSSKAYSIPATPNGFLLAQAFRSWYWERSTVKFAREE